MARVAKTSTRFTEVPEKPPEQKGFQMMRDDSETALSCSEFQQLRQLERLGCLRYTVGINVFVCVRATTCGYFQRLFVDVDNDMFSLHGRFNVLDSSVVSRRVHHNCITNSLDHHHHHKHFLRGLNNVIIIARTTGVQTVVMNGDSNTRVV